MKLKYLLTPLLILPLLSGCSIFGGPKVPQTEIKFNPKNDALNVKSPKDVTIDSVSISQSNGNFSMVVTGYKSTNNAALVSTVVTAQALIASNASVTINSLANLGASIAGKAP